MTTTSHRKETANSFNQLFYKNKIKGYQLKKFEKVRTHWWSMITNHHTKITATYRTSIGKEIFRLMRMHEVNPWLNIKIKLNLIRFRKILDLLNKIETVYHWKKSLRILRIATQSSVFRNLKINWRMNPKGNWGFPISKSMKTI